MDAAELAAFEEEWIDGPKRPSPLPAPILDRDPGDETKRRRIPIREDGPRDVVVEICRRELMSEGKLDELLGEIGTVGP